MSQINKIVTSLEVSRKLKDLGIAQESCFYWVEFENKWILEYDPEWKDKTHGCESISAFTVEELWYLMGGKHISYLNCERQGEWITENIGTTFVDINNNITEITIDYLNQNLKKWRDSE